MKPFLFHKSRPLLNLCQLSLLPYSSYFYSYPDKSVNDDVYNKNATLTILFKESYSIGYYESMKRTFIETKYFTRKWQSLELRMMTYGSCSCYCLKTQKLAIRCREPADFVK